MVRRIGTFVISGLLVLACLFVLTAYYLALAPKIVRMSPGENESGTALNRKIVIEFDRPVSRRKLNPTISPSMPGRWVYDQSLIPNHMMRRLTFVPGESLPPDTEFKISLDNVQNVRRTSKEFSFVFRFFTQESPKISRIEPGNNVKSVRPDTKIEVYLTAPNGNLSQINFEFTPKTSFKIKEDITKTHLTIIPEKPLSQGTEYQLSIFKADLVMSLTSNEVVKSGIEKLIYTDNFTTKEAVGVESFLPLGNRVTGKQPIIIKFTRPMIEREVIRNFSIFPLVEGTPNMIDKKTFEYSPKKYDFNTSYTVKLSKGTHAADGSFLPDDLSHTFSTLGNVLVEKITPRNLTVGADPQTPIQIYFDQDVIAESAMTKFTISPNIGGKFSYEDKVLTFTPDKSLSLGTTYTVKIEKSVSSTEGPDTVEDFTSTFTTEPESVVLEVPMYLQQHSLSCEAAALRMALAYRKIDVAEDPLIGQIGFDKTLHSKNIWGDPQTGFVGSIDGRQMITGYGVYWKPISRVANEYRTSTDFTGWTSKMILTEIKKGNPVILWSYSSNGTPTSWFTPLGSRIFAVAGEHAVVVTGYVGTVDNPTQIVVNDPLDGRNYWDSVLFTKKLSTFGGSGVVIY